MTQHRVVIHFHRGAVAVAVMAALLLAGCADTDRDTTPATPNLSTPSAAATGSDVTRFPSIVPVPSGEKPITMPRLDGLTTKQALTALSEAGWTAGKDSLAPQGVIVPDDEPTDVILSQQPPSGTVMSEKTAVVVQVGVHN